MQKWVTVIMWKHSEVSVLTSSFLISIFVSYSFDQNEQIEFISQAWVLSPAHFKILHTSTAGFNVSLFIFARGFP